ncbi:hypothetical protein [Microbacterium yannicii]|uniref:hypothetical protein n=1 Tax=Microbacterium yannicii TaxID=671622 RepID=UPI0002DE205B|nr:hypothetical protein [Microbacterium yannicii]
MSDVAVDPAPRLARIFLTEEAIYGLILVSGMLVITGAADATSVVALVTVAVTVIVFFAAHVYAGALARLAADKRRWSVRTSLRSAAFEASGMLLASVAPLAILTVGATRVLDDGTAIWTALIVNTILLGVLGWIAVARWSPRWYVRVGGALVTAAFGGALILLKSLVSH